MIHNIREQNAFCCIVRKFSIPVQLFVRRFFFFFLFFLINRPIIVVLFYWFPFVSLLCHVFFRNTVEFKSNLLGFRTINSYRNIYPMIFFKTESMQLRIFFMGHAFSLLFELFSYDTWGLIFYWTLTFA